MKSREKNGEPREGGREPIRAVNWFRNDVTTKVSIDLSTFCRSNSQDDDLTTGTMLIMSRDNNINDTNNSDKEDDYNKRINNHEQTERISGEHLSPRLWWNIEAWMNAVLPWTGQYSVTRTQTLLERSLCWPPSPNPLTDRGFSTQNPLTPRAWTTTIFLCGKE